MKHGRETACGVAASCMRCPTCYSQAIVPCILFLYALRIRSRRVPSMRRNALIILACLALVHPTRADDPPAKAKRGWFDPLLYRDAAGQALDYVRHVEFVEMATAVLKGSDMGPNDGWFR